MNHTQHEVIGPSRVPSSHQLLSLGPSCSRSQRTPFESVFTIQSSCSKNGRPSSILSGLDFSNGEEPTRSGSWMGSTGRNIKIHHIISSCPSTSVVASDMASSAFCPGTGNQQKRDLLTTSSHAFSANHQFRFLCNSKIKRRRVQLALVDITG